MTAYGPQEVIEEVARALQKLRPATWGLEQRSFSSAFPVYQSFFFRQSYGEGHFLDSQSGRDEHGAFVPLS